MSASDVTVEFSESKNMIFRSPILAALVTVTLTLGEPARCAAEGSTAQPLDGEISAPSISLPIIANGEGQLNLEAHRGSVVYLDFWASWCGPCRRSLPALDELYREFEADGFQVLAISVDMVEEDALDFLNRYVVTYPVALDVTGASANAFGVNGMPSGYLIDRQGKVREVHVGFRKGDADKLRADILEVLRES